MDYKKETMYKNEIELLRNMLSSLMDKYNREYEDRLQSEVDYLSELFTEHLREKEKEFNLQGKLAPTQTRNVSCGEFMSYIHLEELDKWN